MLKPIRVLITDNNAEFAQLLKLRLELYKQIKVIGIATSGMKALKMLEQCDVDVLLLDIVMPGMDGLVLLKKIRSIGKRPTTIIISALGSDDIVKKALALGANHYFHKPVDCSQLIATIQNTGQDNLSLIKTDIEDC